MGSDRDARNESFETLYPEQWENIALEAPVTLGDVLVVSVWECQWSTIDIAKPPSQ